MRLLLFLEAITPILFFFVLALGLMVSVIATALLLSLISSEREHNFEFDIPIAFETSFARSLWEVKSYLVGLIPTQRFVDFVMSILFLVTILPLMVVICGLIFAIDGRPIFSRTKCYGQNGKQFLALRFRSIRRVRCEASRAKSHNYPAMPDDLKYDENLAKEPNFIPIIGHFLRDTGLEDLPLFFNVLIGDMSIVGPKAKLHQGHQVDWVGSLDVRPGITSGIMDSFRVFSTNDNMLP